MNLGGPGRRNRARSAGVVEFPQQATDPAVDLVADGTDDVKGLPAGSGTDQSR